ncbi:MAG: aminoglycoside phosphotransferase family protein [Sulfurifustis sp.]
MPDQRLAALSEWAARLLNDPHCTVSPASADASFRRYFRVRTAAQSFIVMDAPPDKEDCGPFIRIARAFRALDLNVPAILAQDLERGFLLLGDLGERLYLAALDESSVERLYGDAMAALVRLQSGSRTLTWLPPYDDQLLRREMELFREWYLQRHRAIELDARRHAVLDAAYDRLTAAALEQPRVAVHRDYHSRNLMVTPENNPGILDFQDAVYGPVTYDLVSLLRDCYVAWGRERVEGWVRAYYLHARRAGVEVGDDPNRFLRWFDWMGVQRHLKASGIFARLNHRDGKPGYLKDIPRTLGYVLDVTARYPELRDLHALLGEIGPADRSAAQ